MAASSQTRRACAGPRSRSCSPSGYTPTAIVHHGRLDPGVLLLAKPYRKIDLARMIRMALDGAVAPAAVDRVA